MAPFGNLGFPAVRMSDFQVRLPWVGFCRRMPGIMMLFLAFQSVEKAKIRLKTVEKRHHLVRSAQTAGMGSNLVMLRFSPSESASENGISSFATLWNSESKTCCRAFFTKSPKTIPLENRTPGPCGSKFHWQVPGNPQKISYLTASYWAEFFTAVFL